MNPIIETYFNNIEIRLIQSSVIANYRILRREISHVDGKLRIRALLINQDIVELFEYVAMLNKQIKLLKYSFHWQDKKGQIRQRWDNAPHYPELPYSPHHVHNTDGTVQGVYEDVCTVFVIDRIEEYKDVFV